MSRREYLDARIRRAWPIAPDTTVSPPSSAQRMRTLIDERIAGGAEPDTSRMDAPAPHPHTPQGPRRLAIVLVGAVLITSVVVTTALVAGRLRPQDRPSQIEFADEPTANELAPRVPADPNADVRAAIAATRRAAADLTVRDVARFWLNRNGRRFADVNAFIEQTTPFDESTKVIAANGDWSFQDRWNTEGTNTRLREPGGCSEIADCAEPFGAMRFVGGRYYERAYNTPAWEHVIADDGQELSKLVRNGLAMEGVRPPDVLAVADALEHYNGEWTAVPGGQAGITSYQAADNDKAFMLATELHLAEVLSGSAARAVDAMSPGITTVQVWIDDESGLLQRVFTEQLHTGPRSPKEITKHATLARRNITLTHGGESPVAAPEQATDITLDEWCTRERNVAWCE